MIFIFLIQQCQMSLSPHGPIFPYWKCKIGIVCTEQFEILEHRLNNGVFKCIHCIGIICLRAMLASLVEIVDYLSTWLFLVKEYTTWKFLVICTRTLPIQITSQILKLYFWVITHFMVDIYHCHIQCPLTGCSAYCSVRASQKNIKTLNSN